MKLTIALLSLSLFSCASNAVYVGGTAANFKSGIAEQATNKQSGLELGYMTGNGTVMLDVGIRSDAGFKVQPSTPVQSDQINTHLGLRAYAPDAWVVRPYIGAGVMHQRNTFRTNSYKESDGTLGTYLRLGAELKLNDAMGIDVSFETTDLNGSKIGGRDGLDLAADAFLVGFVFRF